VRTVNDWLGAIAKLTVARERGCLTSEICETLRVTPPGARKRLIALEARGLVESVSTRKQPLRWLLTPNGLAEFLNCKGRSS
jgi:predicted ArsR family transcriptional regulator